MLQREREENVPGFRLQMDLPLADETRDPTATPQPDPDAAPHRADGARAVAREARRAHVALPAREQPPHGSPPGHDLGNHRASRREHAPLTRRVPVSLRAGPEDPDVPRAVRTHAA